MADLDLDIIAQKQKSIKLFGKEIALKNITMEEHLMSEFTIQEMESTPLINEKNIQTATKLMAKYLTSILEISEEEASKVTIEQYKAIRKFMGRKEMYDQGFNDKEIDMLEKKAVKKQAARIK